jgi:LEA14-like dessication related protein
VKARVLLPLLIAAGAAGCSLFYEAPQIELGAVTMGELGRQGASFDVALAVHNPNRFDFGIERLTYRLSLAGVEEASGTMAEPVNVPAKGSATVRLPVALDWTRLQAAGLAMLFSRRMEYIVEGEPEFTTPRGLFRRPYRQTGTIDRLEINSR